MQLVSPAELYQRPAAVAQVLFAYAAQFEALAAGERTAMLAGNPAEADRCHRGSILVAYAYDTERTDPEPRAPRGCGICLTSCDLCTTCWLKTLKGAAE